MSVLVGPDSRVLIQGITGERGRRAAADLLGYGTSVVAGVVPGRGGQDVVGVPVWDSVDEAVAATGADVSLVMVPGTTAGVEAVYEAAEAGVRLIVWPADPVPLHDTVRLRSYIATTGSRLVGPNTPGVISPGRCKVGFMPSHCYVPGPVGVISRSGSLSYEVCLRLTRAGLGQSTVVGIGGDPVKGTTFGDALAMFANDPETRVVLLLGEAGGLDEYEAMRYLTAQGAKPAAAYLVGRAAPRERKLGHAGAFVLGERSTYAAKAAAFREAGIPLAERLGEIPPLVADCLRRALDGSVAQEVQ